MTIKELEKQIAELQKQLNEMKGEKIWKPQNGETYFYVDYDGTIEEDNNNEYTTDLARIKFGNCYQTEEKAEFEANREKYTRLFRQYVEQHTAPLDWNDRYQTKHYVALCDNKIKIVFIVKNKDAFQIYASSEQILEDAIEFVGEENFKKYVFEVE